MADVYGVGVSLKLTGNLERQLGTLLKEMQKVEAASKRVQKELNGWGIRSNTFASITRLENRMRGLVGVAQRTGRDMKSGLAPAFTSALTEARSVRSTITGWGTAATSAAQKINSAASAMRRATAGAGAGGTLHPRPGRSAGGGSGHSGSWFPEIAAGLGGMAIVRSMSQHSGEYSHQVTQLRKLGISEAQVAEAQRAAAGTAGSVKGVTEQKALSVYGQAYSLLGHEGAIRTMTPLTKFAEVSGNTSGDYHGAYESMYAMLRSGELMGRFTDHKTHLPDVGMLEHFLDLGAKTNAASHGKINAQTWLGLAQQGGPAISGMDDKGLLTMAIVAQAMGGMRAGTALTGLYQQMVGGTMAESKARKLQELGLVGGYSVGRGGHLNWDKGALDGQFSQTLKQDPLAAIQVMKGAMEGKGLDTIDKQVPHLFEILGRQTTQRIVHELLRNSTQNVQERDRIMGGLGVGASKSLADNHDYSQAMHNFNGAWEKFLTTLGNSEATIAVLKMLTSALETLNSGLKSLAPEQLKVLGIGITALGAAFVGAAGLAIMGAIGAGGWLIIGLAALGTAIAELAVIFPKALDAIGSAWGRLKGALGVGGGGAEGSSNNGGVSPDVYGFGGATVQKQSLNSVTGIPNAGSAIARSSGFHPALLDAARAGGAGRITSLNSGRHSANGMHPRGLAVDMTGNPASIMARTRSSMAAAGLVEGKDYKLINEYAHRSKHWSGPHVHFQFQTRRAADQFRSHAAPPPPPNSGSGQMVQNHIHIDGQKIAQVVTRHQVRGANGPSQGGNGADYTRLLPQVA